MLLEGTFHTAGVLQLSLRGAAGIGQLVRIQCDCSELPALDGKVSPAFMTAAGVRFRVAQHVWLGWDLGVTLFTGVGHDAGSYLGSTPPAESGLIKAAFVMALSAAWSGR